MKMHIMAILAHLWPDFGLLWPQDQCFKLSLSVFVLFLAGLREIGKKIRNKSISLNEDADVLYLQPFLPFSAFIWPTMAPVSVFKAHYEYIIYDF